MRKKERAREVRQRLAEAMPEPGCDLDFETGWQLLDSQVDRFLNDSG